MGARGSISDAGALGDGVDLHLVEGPSPAAAEALPYSLDDARILLHARLLARRDDIEQALLTRLLAIAGSNDLDPTYAEGLRASVSVTVDFYLAALESVEELAVPTPILAQARTAARSGIGFDTVLQRCFAGRLVLAEFLIDEVQKSGFDRAVLQKLMRLQRSRAAIFDRLLTAVSEEYMRETKKRSASSEQRRVEQIKRLLAGETVDVSQFHYDFEGHHLGLIASGPGAAEVLRELATVLDRRLLTVAPAEESVWAWLGGRRPLDPAELRRVAGDSWPDRLSLAIGERGEGMAGWCLSHRQACAALPVAVRRPEPIARYGDVALLASTLQDDFLVTSLRRIFLEPLQTKRGDGEALQATLRAYFASERNVSSAAALLGVTRQTVSSRLRVVEECLGRQLSECSAEIDIALRLKSLDSPTP